MSHYVCNFHLWDGPGIRTSMAAAKEGVATLGIGEAHDVLFLGEGETALGNGVTVDATTVMSPFLPQFTKTDIDEVPRRVAATACGARPPVPDAAGLG